MPSENILFHKGLSWDGRSALQQPGYLKVAKNILFEVDGSQTLRPQFTALNSTALASVHSLKRFKTLVLAGANVGLYSSSGGDFTTLSTAFSSAPWVFKQYKNFLHASNGAYQALFDASGNLYPAKIANPASAPTLADSGAGGNPNGHYFGYVSYKITWPNGHTYETGLSAASADVNVVTNKIAWTAIPVCPYAAYYGTEPTITRNLYRGPGTGGSLGDIYFVATIADNTTTTYTDDLSDASIAAAGASYVDDYGPQVDAKYFEYHYGRLHMIDSTNVHRVYYSEAVSGLTAAENEVLMPLAMPTNNWDDLRTSGFGEVDPQGIIAWGVSLYIPLKQTWVRRQGNDPASWSYKKTWATHGIAAPYTVDLCSEPMGIIGVTNADGGSPGIAVFNGSSSDVLAAPRLDYILETDLNIAQIDKCRGKVVGRYYHLFYPSGSATAPDKHLVLDMRRGTGDIRISYWDGLKSVSVDTDTQGKNFYIGGSDGVVRLQSGTTEAIDVDIETHELIGGDLKVANLLKNLKELKYNLNSGGDTISLEIYIDGTKATFTDGTTVKSIDGTADLVQILRSLPKNFEGYRYRLRLYATGLTTFELFSPWSLDFDVKQ